MKPQTFVMVFKHITGTRCRITVTESAGELVEVAYSLRSGSASVCDATAQRWISEWQMWFLHFIKSPVAPQIPAGWQ